MHREHVDVESLQRRTRCLDGFLVLSVAFLFLAVALVTFVGAMEIMELRASIGKRPDTNPGHAARTGDPGSPGYKMQKVAYLRASSSTLKNRTVVWDKVLYGPGDSVGSLYHYEKSQNALKPARNGTYFLYLELNLTCTATCNAGLLTVAVGNKLTCQVELPREVFTPVTRKCWTVTQMEADSRLVAQMTVGAGLKHWKLELTGSGMGLFLVD